MSASKAAAVVLTAFLQCPEYPPQPVRLPGDEFWKFECDEATQSVSKALVRKARGGGLFTMMGLPVGKKPEEAEENGQSSAPKLHGTALTKYSVIAPNDADAAAIAKMRQEKPEGTFLHDKKLDRALGSFVSMAVGDALGSPLEFRPVRYDDAHPLLTGFSDANGGTFGLKPGQWTDDASMGACIADSLLWCQRFDAYDMKTRFVSWWNLGYNNATRLAPKGGHSVGLGGNISMSFDEFMRTGKVFTTAGDSNTSGNGSLMRNGAIPVFFHNDLQTAVSAARAQSYLTHQGVEAAECCAAMTHLVVHAINNPEQSKETIFEEWKKSFRSDCDTVNCLVQSRQEPGGNPDRNWQWQGEEHRYSPTRSQQMPGYIGSYAMDALAMALHCVWKSKTYEEALLLAANRCGDADTVCDITGQVAGAIYGEASIPRDWLKYLNQWDGDEFAVKAYKMFYRKPLRYPPVVEEE